MHSHKTNSKKKCIKITLVVITAVKYNLRCYEFQTDIIAYSCLLPCSMYVTFKVTAVISLTAELIFGISLS